MDVQHYVATIDHTRCYTVHVL